jgi:hypothetical protein
MAFRSVPRPSSPPGAKASTECPSYTRYPGLAPAKFDLGGASLTMHRNHPQGVVKDDSWKYCVFRNTYRSPSTNRTIFACASIEPTGSIRSATTSLTTRYPTNRGATLPECKTFQRRAPNPVRTVDRTTGPPPTHELPHGPTSIARVQRRNRT